MREIDWRPGVAGTAAVFIITLPFTGWSTAVLLGLAAGLYMLLTEGGLNNAVAGSRALRKLHLPSTGGLSARVSGKISGRRGNRTLLFAGLCVVAASIPFLLNRYQTDVATLALIYVSLAVGLNIIVGLCGLLVLGYIAFYAVGAYTYALLNVHYGVNFFLCLPIGFLTGAVAGGLVGLPVLRLRGDYLAIVTLGFGEIVRIVLNNWDELTAGPNGIMNIARPSLFGLKLGTTHGYYYLAALLAAAVMFTQTRLTGTKVGRAWEAIREDELAAAHSGVPVFKMKMQAMMLGGAWAGAAGALFAARMTHVSPESFTFLESVLVLSLIHI